MNTVPAFPADDAFGFAGTIQSNSRDEATGVNGIDSEAARRLWTKACEAVAGTFAETDATVISHFLRSPAGRHCADAVYDQAHPNRDEASLADAIGKVLAQRKQVWSRLGGMKEVLVWQNAFADIRQATVDGTWIE